MSTKPAAWHRELTRYHWFVLIVAALGWLFDTMDQQIFTLARGPAMRELLAQRAEALTDDELVRRAADAGMLPGEAESAVRSAVYQQVLGQQANFYGGLATSVFLVGWATGGIAFGVLGDRIGRAKTMLLTILIYSLCTGLSALSVGFWDFALYRFLTGLGVGGEFAVGVALVAEVMPERARPHALGLLQALSAVGNISAALISMAMVRVEASGALDQLAVGEVKLSAWRLMFVVGTLPALLAILIRRRLKEPERWQQMAAAGAAARQLGSYGELFGDPRWRKHAVVGLCLAFSGVVGLWGIGFFSVDLIGDVLKARFAASGLSAAEQAQAIGDWRAIALILQNVGGFLGIYAYAKLTVHWGRKWPFALFFVLAMLSTALVFGRLSTFGDIFWMLPVMGFCQLALFGGYAIYFPELFPTRLRSTGTSFCYNVGRFVAAVGPYTFGYLTSVVFADTEAPLRYAGVSMCSVFLLGLAVLPFAPETRGQPLPE
jgi:MFS family permease